MNKSALVEAVAEKLGGTKTQAEEVLDAVFGVVADAMKTDDGVSVPGFGIFTSKGRAARTARNPRTGEPIEVPAMRVPKFKAAKALKDSVK